jgi:hypothetical protein
VECVVCVSANVFGSWAYVHSYFDSALAACVQFNDSITGSIAVLVTGYFVDKP